MEKFIYCPKLFILKPMLNHLLIFCPCAQFVDLNWLHTCKNEKKATTHHLYEAMFPYFAYRVTNNILYLKAFVCKNLGLKMHARLFSLETATNLKKSQN